MNIDYSQIDDQQYVLSLIAPHIELMMHIGRTYTRDYCDAEEVVQDSMLKILKYIGGFENNCTFKNWICKITRNIAISKARRGDARKSGLHLSLDAGDGLLYHVIPSNYPDAREELDNNDLRERCPYLINKLEKIHFEILDLRISKEMSYQAISEHLGINIQTVKSRINRAREHLKKLYNK